MENNTQQTSVVADLADMMWLATGEFGADLSKSFSKKVLEIVLDTEILAPSTVSSFGKDKTPKALDNQVKAYLQACLQGRSRRLLREPLPRAKKRKAPP